MDMPPETSSRAFPNPWQTLALLGIFVAFSLGIGILFGPWLGDDPADLPSWFLLVGTAVPMGATVWVAQQWRGGGSLALRSVPPQFYLLTILLGLPVAGLASLLIEVFDIPDYLEELLQGMAQQTGVYTFLAVVVAAPILEELLFRSIILGGFLKRYSPIKAIFWSALLFGVYHFNPAQIAGAFLIGLALGYLFWRTRSVWPCIVLHAVNNGLGYWMLSREELSDLTLWEWLGGSWAVAGFALGCLALTAVAIWAVERQAKTYLRTEEDFLP